MNNPSLAPPWINRYNPKSDHYKDQNGYAPPSIPAIKKHLGRSRMKLVKQIIRNDESTSIEVIDGYHNFITKLNRIYTDHGFFKEHIKRDFLVRLTNFFLQVRPKHIDMSHLQYAELSGHFEYLSIKSMLTVHPAEFLHFHKQKYQEAKVILGVENPEQYKEILERSVHQDLNIRSVKIHARFPKL